MELFQNTSARSQGIWGKTYTCTNYWHLNILLQNTIQMFGVRMIFKTLLLNKPAFIWSKIQWNIITVQNNFSVWIYLFLWSKLYFQHHYSSLQCHMIFRNHYNMLICCWRNISDYYQCWNGIFWRTFKRKTFIWNIYFFNLYECLYCHFCSL